MAKEIPNALQMAVLLFLLMQKLLILKGNERYLKELQNEPNPIALAQFVWKWR